MGKIKQNFKQNDLVYLINLGENTPGKYLAKVVGKSSDHIVDFYIVKLIDKLPGNDSWTHRTIIETCMEPAIRCQ